MTSHVIFETYLIMCLNFWQVTVKNDDYQHTKIQYCIWSSVLFGGTQIMRNVILLLLMALIGFLFAL